MNNDDLFHRSRFHSRRNVLIGGTLAGLSGAMQLFSLDVDIDYVPASFVSADTRSQWVLKV